MNNILKVIAVISLFFAIFSIGFHFGHTYGYTNIESDTIKKLTAENDSLFYANDSINRQINKLEMAYEEMVNSINTNSTADNEQFFSDYINRFRENKQ